MPVTIYLNYAEVLSVCGDDFKDTILFRGEISGATVFRGGFTILFEFMIARRKVVFKVNY
jgi:hypothetical protein